MDSLYGAIVRIPVFVLLLFVFLTPLAAGKRSSVRAKPAKSKLLSKAQLIAAARNNVRSSKRADANRRVELASKQRTVLKSKEESRADAKAARNAAAEVEPATASSSRKRAAETGDLKTGYEHVSRSEANEVAGLRTVGRVATRDDVRESVAKAMVFENPAVPQNVGPDVIEVIESNSPETKKLEDIYREDVKRPVTATVPNVSRKRIDITRMDSDRITQIQEALNRKGYLTGSASGVYDSTTEEAMRKFQTDHKVDVTGFPTAQSLKLLGLMDWQ